MEAEMTTDQYKLTIKKLVELMNVPSVSKEKRAELTSLLDKIDAYNGMDFFKIKSN